MTSKRPEYVISLDRTLRDIVGGLLGIFSTAAMMLVRPIRSARVLRARARRGFGTATSPLLFLVVTYALWAWVDSSYNVVTNGNVLSEHLLGRYERSPVAPLDFPAFSAILLYTIPAILLLALICRVLEVVVIRKRYHRGELFALASYCLAMPMFWFSVIFLVRGIYNLSSKGDTTGMHGWNLAGILVGIAHPWLILYAAFFVSCAFAGHWIALAKWLKLASRKSRARRAGQHTLRFVLPALLIYFGVMGFNATWPLLLNRMSAISENLSSRPITGIAQTASFVRDEGGQSGTFTVSMWICNRHDSAIILEREATCMLVNDGTEERPIPVDGMIVQHESSPTIALVTPGDTVALSVTFHVRGDDLAAVRGCPEGARQDADQGHMTVHLTLHYRLVSKHTYLFKEPKKLTAIATDMAIEVR